MQKAGKPWPTQLPCTLPTYYARLSAHQSNIYHISRKNLQIQASRSHIVQGSALGDSKAGNFEKACRELYFLMATNPLFARHELDRRYCLFSSDDSN